MSSLLGLNTCVFHYLASAAHIMNLLYTLPDDSAKSVSPKWFDEQLTRRVYTSPFLKGFLDTQVAALEAYHAGVLSPQDAAKRITQPITDAPVPDPGTYSDEISAVVLLWRLLIDALVEWPSSRTRDLIRILAAVSRIPDALHCGQATNDDNEQLVWSDMPYIGLTWYDVTWMQPDEIVRRTPDPEARQQARLV